MIDLAERYFSFMGRLARIPFFVRNIYVSIVLVLLFVATIPLFSQGGALLWWLTIALLAAGAAAAAVSTASLMVRRLHDIGLSGYHVIWVAAAELVSTLLSFGQGAATLLIGLPLAAVGLWLLFWPGNAGANRFGEQP